MNRAIVEIEDFSIAYLEKPVVFDVDLNFVENSVTAIIGPNGAGKSTLIKGILGLIKPLSGEVKVFGGKIENSLKRIAYIPQTETVNWDFPVTVKDVVLMGRYVHTGLFKRPSESDKRKALEAIEEMGIMEFCDRQISELSGGQKQRVFFARAICQDADLYFMDEPLKGLDVKTERVIMSKFKEFKDNGKTLIVVHHDLSTIKENFDHIVMINKRIISDGPTKAIFNTKNLELCYGVGV